ncbi:MAG: glycoside hydrolase TIM-barrel-like domain-containing protein [Sediminicola sp.]
MKAYRFLSIMLLFLSCREESHKVNGVSFVASREKVAQEHLDAVLAVNANYAAVMPFGFMPDVTSPEIHYDTERQWYGETKEGARQYIDQLHKNGLKVMLKPQLWIWRGTFTGTLKMDSEEKWLALESSYEAFIMHFANLAGETGVELFCIGTELGTFVRQRPTYWFSLIKKIRTVYQGKLTYAANWDEYTNTPFWKEVDMIGIDAYFPLSQERTPTVAELVEKWQPFKVRMQQLSEEMEKPILFTEFGYRSNDYTAMRPWTVDRHTDNINMHAQTNATKAVFDAFWSEDWFRGGFVWKWFMDHKVSGGPTDNRFTPQNKPAEEVIRHYYKIY